MRQIPRLVRPPIAIPRRRKTLATRVPQAPETKTPARTLEEQVVVLDAFTRVLARFQTFFETLAKSSFDGPLCQHHEYELGKTRAEQVRSYKADLKTLRAWIGVAPA